MTAPYITVAGTSYALESLSDRARMLSSDLLRTIQEYRAMLTSYRETLALTGAYTGGLKDAVQKADLPIALNTDNNPETPIIKIGDVSYEAGDLPDSVKASVSALVRSLCWLASSCSVRLRPTLSALSRFLTCPKICWKHKATNATENQVRPRTVIEI